MKKIDSILANIENEFGKVDKANLIISRIYNNPQDKISSSELELIKNALIEAKHSSIKDQPLIQLSALLSSNTKNLELENAVLEIITSIISHGIELPTEALENLGRAFSVRPDLTTKLSQIFKMVASQQELPKHIKYEIASRLKNTQENSENRRGYYHILQAPRVSLDKEMVVELSGAIEAIKQQEGSSIGSTSLLSPEQRADRLELFKLLHSKYTIPDSQKSYVKALSEADYPPFEKSELQKIAQDIEAKEKKLKVLGLLLEPKTVTTQNVDILLDAEDPFPQTQTAALNFIINEFKANKKVPKKILTKLEDLLNSGRVHETSTNSFWHIFCVRVIKDKDFAVQDQTITNLTKHITYSQLDPITKQNLSMALELLMTSSKSSVGVKELTGKSGLTTEAIFRGLMQISLKQKTLPKPVVTQLVNLSRSDNADLPVRLHSLALLQDCPLALTKQNLSDLAENLEDKEFFVANSTKTLLKNYVDSSLDDNRWLARVLKRNIINLNGDLKDQIKELVESLEFTSPINAANDDILLKDKELQEPDLVDKQLIAIPELKLEELSPPTEKLESTLTLSKFGTILTSKQLIESIASLNAKNPSISKLIENAILVKQFNAVQDAYIKDSTIMPQNLEISKWERSSLQTFAEYLLANPNIARNKNNLPEIIAVTMRANKIHTDNDLRDAQLLSILILANNNEGKGRLAQIGTGEGKSTTTATFAAVKALQGEKVDIVTSSQILAQRDAEEWQSFYHLLNLKCGHNIDHDYQTGLKECYENQIVYGDVGSYQADWIKTVYKDLGTRGSREFGTVIVDEVDAMLIDESSKIVKLSSALPGSEYLAPFFIAGWRELEGLSKHIVYLEEQKSHIFIPGGFEYKNGRLVFLDNKSDVLIIENLNEFKKSHLAGYFHELLQQNSIIVPSHLKSQVLDQIEDWASSAVMAESMQLKRDYLIISDNHEEQIIAPVDYLNTGIIQGNTVWEKGLHQFLQVKHGLKISSESYTTSFISNMGYFQAYKESIFGLTGTLGSEQSQDLLQEVYGVDIAFIPNYKVKQFKELPGIITDDKQQWLNAIMQSCKLESDNKRAVLVICKTIQDVEDTEAKLQEGKSNFAKIIRYSRNDNDENLAIKNVIDSGQIIIATNLAGRGTDIKLSRQVESNGGLHVAVTFLPTNSRVEEQAFGRTARQGKPGTAQLILNKESLVKQLRLKGEASYAVDQFKQIRDLYEQHRIKLTKELEVPKLSLNDQLFGLYTKFYKELKAIDANKYKLMQLEEDWGVHFKKTQQIYDSSTMPSDTKTKDALAHFEKFKSESANAFHANKLAKNPAYLVMQGFNSMGNSNSYLESIDLYTQATNLDDMFSFAARYNRAYAILRNGYKESARAGKATSGYTAYHKDVLQDLNIVQQQLEQFIIPQTQSMQILLPNSAGTALTRQIQNKLEIMQLLLSNVKTAMSSLASGEVNEAMKVGDNTRLLVSFFDSNKVPRSELAELQNWGLIQLYDIDKKELGSSGIDAMGVCALGMAQAVFGALAVASGNVGLGVSLIAEGFKDFYTASNISEGGFRWNNYFVDKGISAAINVATAGAEKLFAAKPPQTIENKILSDKLKKEAVVKAIDQQTKNQLIKQAIIRTVVSTAANVALSNVSKAAIKENQKGIVGSVENKINYLLNNSPNKERLNHILAIDQFNGNSNYLNFFKTQVRNLLSEKRHMLAEISSGVLQSLIQSQNSKLAIAATVLKGVEVGHNLDKSIRLADEFCYGLAEKLSIVHSQTPDLATLLFSKLRPALANVNEANELVGYLTKASIWDGKEFNQAKLASMATDNLALGKYETIKARLTELVQNLNKVMLADYAEARNNLASEISSSLSGAINSKLTNKVAMPIATGFISSFSDKVAKKLVGDINSEIAKIAEKPADQQLEELKEIAEAISIKGISAGDEFSKEETEKTFLSSRARDIIELIGKYEKFAEEYPWLAEKALTIVFGTLDALRIGYKLSMSTNPLTMVASEIGTKAFTELTSGVLQEGVEASINKGQEWFLEYDKTLTPEEAHALAATVVVGGMIATTTASEAKNSFAMISKTIGKPKVTNANPLHLESSNKSEGMAPTSKSLSEIGETKEPWMKKNSLSAKQREQLEGIKLYGKNPGKVDKNDAKGLFKINTELPGGEKAARNMFEKMTGEKSPILIEHAQGKDFTLGNGIEVRIRMGKSGHPKLEITTPTDKGKILEKITFKEWNYGE